MSTEKIMEQPVNVRLLEALKGLMALSDHRVDLRDQAKAARSAIAAAEAREMRDEYRSASCDDVARRVDECMTLRAERDALAAKLAELEGQEPTAWMNAKRDMASFIHFHEDDLPLFARPVPVEPVNVDFGMRGENMFFQIGNQSFLLDYKPEEQGEFEFMKAMLLSAFSRITHGVKTEIQPVNTRLLTALKACRNKLAHDAAMVAMADVAIMAAEAAPRVARLTHPDIAKALASAGLKPEDYRDDGEIFPLVVAIESAALRKNGLALED